MEKLKDHARELIDTFKGSDYIYGLGCLDRIGELAAPFGSRALLITSLDRRDQKSYAAILDSLSSAGVEVAGQTTSSRPNTPREDVLRMRQAVLDTQPDFVLAASGGSGIDAAKASVVLADLGGEFDEYFGTGKVTDKIQDSGLTMRPCLGLQTASGSSAHLTKYSNITDLTAHQKKLIVDDAIIPPRCLFDYSLTATMSPDFTLDGAFDGISHCLEVYYGAPPEIIGLAEDIALSGIELTLAYLERSLIAPNDLEAREALGLAADLGGYAVMVGGTNGGHLTSFSLVDILSHGRACAIMNPYYTVFFAPAIQRHLKNLAGLLLRYDLIASGVAALSGRELGEAVAQGLMAFSRRVGYPTHLKEVPGMTETHLSRTLEAAKDPQLDMKLKNMPVPLSAGLVDEYMGPILEAAYTKDLSLIRSMASE
ncbi:MAG: iron-containing alcohol dehydrogenase [Candidatus Aminicenantaceae bacterium]